MKDATRPSVINVTLRAVTVDRSVAAPASRLRTEIAAGISEALLRPERASADDPRSIGTRVGQAIAARLAENGFGDASPGDARAGAAPDGGRDGK